MKKKLEALTQKLIKHKRFVINREEELFDEMLFKKGVLKENGNDILVNDFSAIAPYFFSHYKCKLSFEVTEDFQDSVEFINDIIADFTAGNNISRSHLLEKALLEIIIKEANNKYNTTFKAYISTFNLEEKSLEFFNFSNAYSSQLSSLTIAPEIIYENAKALLEGAKADAQYNAPLSTVLNGVKELVKKDYCAGKQLLEISLSDPTCEEQLISVIVSGLYDIKGVEFYKEIIKVRLDKNINRDAILFGLSNIAILKDYECQLFIELVERFKASTDSQPSIIALLLAVLNSGRDSFLSEALQLLKSMVKEEKLGHQILHGLWRLDNLEEERIEVVVNLIQQDYFVIEKYINQISQLFWEIKNIKAFKTIILSLAEKSPFTDFSKSFQSFLRTTDKVELDGLIIQLLIDDKALNRFIGISFFNQLSFSNPYKFSFDILTLPAIDQYKLWVSMATDFNQPQNRLVALLPLLNSDSSLVRECFTSKLEYLSEDYGGHIRQLLRENLVLEKDKGIIERIENYIDGYYQEFVEIKNPIKELNPFLTQAKEIMYFKELFQKDMSQNINSSMEENSLMKFFGKSIQLAKGGGFRFDKEGEISQLSHFSSSMAMPRSYFANPDEYEIEYGSLQRKDWTEKEFESLKKCFKNE